jgi:Domain of unknown function (DUF397)
VSDRTEPSQWRKSSYSAQGDCVEWAIETSCVRVRNSFEPASGELRFTYSEWRAFVNGIKSGEGDLPVE